MLENRSFDHLLGFSGVEGISPPVGAQHENPIDLTDPAAGSAPPDDTGEHVIHRDPPHGHVSAKHQMGEPAAATNGGGRRYPMNGFADAHRLKLTNKETLPVIHWLRVGGLAAAASPLLAALVAQLDRRIHHRDITGMLRWTAPASALLAALIGRRPFTEAAGIAPRHLIAAVLAGGAALGAASEGIYRFARHPTRRALPACATALGAALAGVEWARRRHVRKIRPLEGDEAKAAAGHARDVMRCLPPQRIQVIGALAGSFATCARWFSSVPGATWPNRNFLHAGTSEQSVDIEVGFYGATTIFQLLDDDGAPLSGPAVMGALVG